MRDRDIQRQVGPMSQCQQFRRTMEGQRHREVEREQHRREVGFREAAYDKERPRRGRVACIPLQKGHVVVSNPPRKDVT